MSDGYLLMLNMHHIISDALSVDVLARELSVWYDSPPEGGTTDRLPPLKIQYRDFAAWQNELIKNDKIKKQCEYWHNKLSGEIPVLNLPTDYPRPSLQTYNGDRIRFCLEKDVTDDLEKIYQANDSSLFMMLISLVKVLLHRYTSQEDIIIGSPITGRVSMDLENQIGFYVNMLALRDEIKADDPFTQILGRIRKTCLEGYDNQLYPFDRLVDDLHLERDMSRNVLFDVMLVLHNKDEVKREFGGLKISDFEFDVATSLFDLTFTFTEHEDYLETEIEYNTDLFNKARIRRMQTHFEELVRSVIADANQPVCALNILSESERRKILYEFNDTARDYPRDKTLSELVEEQAKKIPDNQAVAYQDVILSYRELNTRANLVAYLLKDNYEIKLEECVGVLMDKSEWMIVAILGILKAGGAYVPIDPSYPSDRIQYIIQDAGCRVILSDAKHTDSLSRYAEIKAIDLAEYFKNTEYNLHLPDFRVPSQNGQSLAYVIYTSGSTGKPKGTLVEHHSVSRLVLHPDYMTFKIGDRVAQTCALTFDVSVFEIWGALVNGCCLCLPREGTIIEAPRMNQFMKRHKIETMWLTTSLFNQLTESDITIFQGLKTLIIGGEKLFAYHINKVRAAYPDLAILNGYGPTENTIFTTFHLIDQFYEKEIPIGKPVANTQILILDANDRVVPVGIPGEICAAGDGVARGYLNVPELTAKKFVPHPFKPGERMYRIGDMGSWRPDGIIDFYGRNDDQVKVRGYRIELGEIENSLLKHPDINQSVVMTRTREDGFNKELIAYFTSDKELDVSELRRFLGESLPGYMIPGYFVPMNRLPLNASGKVDRKALPSPEKAALGGSTISAKPRNDIEEQLLKAWQSILGREGIGIYDNYFALGGDSIKAIQIVSRLRQEHLKIEVRDIFQYPTIAELSENVINEENMTDQCLITGIVKLTPVQSWFFTHHNVGAAPCGCPDITVNHFNQSEMLYSKEGFNEDSLRAVFEKIQEHHDALRMRYSIDGDTVIQENCGIDYPLSFESVNLKDADNAPVRMESYANQVQAGINIATESLMKVVLFKLNDGDRLLIVIHHLVVDGVSWRILAEDILNGYQQYLSGEAIQFPLKTDSFKAWAEHIKEYADTADILKEKEYWKAIESVQVGSFPKDYDKSDTQKSLVKDTRTLNFSLSEDETEFLLTKVNHAYNTEINDILLTAFASSMKIWHGDNRTLITLEGHGRERLGESNLDISRTVGWFTTMYPVLLELPDSEDIGYQIKHIKEMLRRIPNKGIGYGILKYLTSPENKQDISFDCQPQIIFNYMGEFDEAMRGRFQIAKESYGKSVSPDSELIHDIDINGEIMQGILKISVIYNQNAFKSESMEKLGADFKDALQKIIRHCMSIEDTEITPSDLDYDGLSIDELDNVLESL